MPKIQWEKQPLTAPTGSRPVMTSDHQWVGTTGTGGRYRITKGPDVPLGTASTYFYDVTGPVAPLGRGRSLAAAKALAQQHADQHPTGRRGRR